MINEQLSLGIDDQFVLSGVLVVLAFSSHNDLKIRGNAFLFCSAEANENMMLTDQIPKLGLLSGVLSCIYTTFAFV
jgi:hypothetical protein